LVAHIIFRLDYGGLENGVVNLINHMPRESIRHAIICLAGFTEFRQRIDRADVEVYSLDKRPGKDLGAYWRLWRLLRKLKADIVHTRNLGTVDLQWVACLAGVRKRVHGEHGWDSGDLRGIDPKARLIRRVCDATIHRYVAVSQDIARWLNVTVGIAERRITQIYNGVDTGKFSAAGGMPADWPWAEPPARGGVVFGTVGRLVAIKNQSMLLEAFANLKRLFLVMVGDGPMAPELRKLADRLQIADCVWFAGARDDVPNLLRSMDVFVLPSLNEGISNTLLEAMSAGKAIIAGNVGGNAELIENGATGRLFDSREPRQLLECMTAYCDDPELRARHGAAARQSVSRRFSLDAMAGSYFQLYRNLLAE
jgi:sugar transferase (PEP-CTERM/EpsH1 system associated)